MRSLDPRNISNGAAEILKMACIKDEILFNVLDDHAEELRSSSFQVACIHLSALHLLSLSVLVSLMPPHDVIACLLTYDGP